jgi:TonB family protein
VSEPRVILSKTRVILSEGGKILHRAQNHSLSSIPLLAVLVLCACGPRDDGTVRLVDAPSTPVTPPAEEPPVAINPVSPVRYPPALLSKGIEGRVLLRLYVDSAGNVVPDSIRIAESSGYPALDSAALVGAPELRYSPALHQGRPIAAPFLQPVQFRGPRSRSAAP